MKINSKNIEVRVIKLNYLGNYQQKINDLFKNLDEKKYLEYLTIYLDLFYKDLRMQKIYEVEENEVNKDV